MNIIPQSISSRFHCHMHTIFIWLIRLLSIFGVVAFLIVMYGAYFERPLLRYQNLPFPVETPVEQGRTVPIIVERCNDTKEEIIYMSTRSLRNVDTGKVVILPNASIGLRPGCHRGLSRSVTVPLETEVGWYVVEGHAVMRGLVKQHRTEWYTEPFQVIPQTAITKKLMRENESERLHDALTRPERDVK